MSNAVLDETKNVKTFSVNLPIEINDDDDDDLTPEEAWKEVMAEADDIIAHPEKYKFYHSVKEMFKDMGLDVSNLEDD